MKSLILRPLEKEYEVVRISVTQLEGFTLCQKKYNEVPYVQTEAQVFWTIADEMLKNFLINKKHYNEILEYYVVPNQEKNEKKWLSEYLDLALEHIPEILFWDKKMELQIECWPYLVTVPWVIDCYHLNWEISDLKTAAQKRDQDKEYTMLQPYFYTYMFRNEKEWLEEWEKKFSYYILSKHKRDKCTIDIRNMDINLWMAKKRILDTVKKFVISYHTKQYLPKQNMYCRWCPIYKEWKCELFTS